MPVPVDVQQLRVRQLPRAATAPKGYVLAADGPTGQGSTIGIELTDLFRSMCKEAKIAPADYQDLLSFVAQALSPTLNPAAATQLVPLIDDAVQAGSFVPRTGAVMTGPLEVLDGAIGKQAVNRDTVAGLLSAQEADITDSVLDEVDLTLPAKVRSTAVRPARGLAGAKDRSLEGRFADVISIFDIIPEIEHAAIRAGTSTYDCAADFQFVQDTGLVVRMPRGRYNIGASITPSNGTIFVGQRQGTILRRAFNGVMFSCQTAADGCEFHDFTVDGNRTQYPNNFSPIFYATQAGGTLSDFLWSNIRFKDCGSAGIYILGQNTEAMHLAGTGYAPGGGHRVRGCRFNGMDRECVVLFFCNDVKIEGCKVSGYAQAGNAVALVAGRFGCDIEISDNEINGTTFFAGALEAHAVSVENCRRGYAKGNRGKNIKGYAIECAAVLEKGVVADNNFAYCTRPAIVVNGKASLAMRYCENILVANNTAYKCLGGLYIFMGDANGVMKHKNITVVGGGYHSSIDATAVGSRNGVLIGDVDGLYLGGGLQANDNTDSGVIIQNTCDYWGCADFQVLRNNITAQVSSGGFISFVVTTRPGSASNSGPGAFFARGNGLLDAATYVDGVLQAYGSIHRQGSNMQPVRPRTTIGNATTPASSFDVAAARLLYAWSVRAQGAAVTASTTSTVLDYTQAGSLPVTVTSNTTIQFPTGIALQQEFDIHLLQGTTGGWTVGFATAFKFGSYVWSNTGNVAGARAMLRCYFTAAGHITVVAVREWQ